MSCNRRAGQINKHAELTVLYEIESDDDNGDDDCRCHGSSNSLKYMLFENPLIESA